jgi:HPt (histidine-containing phosphotransfer) domain-containing protein
LQVIRRPALHRTVETLESRARFGNHHSTSAERGETRIVMSESISPASRGILDVVQLRANLGGADEATAIEVVEFFLTTVGPVIAEAGAHTAARRAPDLVRVAHAAKGAARNVCAPALADRLAELESAATRDDWQAIDTVMPQVTEAFGQVVQRFAENKPGGAA